MKKLLLLLVAALSIVSCDDTEINEFAMQANIGNRFYQSAEAIASLDEDGGLVITGTSGSETLKLRVSRLGVGNYVIGEGATNSAYFEDSDGNRFTTDPNGTGLISISDFNENTKTLSGSFHFKGILAGIDTVFVSRGVLYNVPYLSGDIIDPTNDGTLSAKINGDLFTSTLVSVTNESSIIEVSGSNLTQRIKLKLPNTVVVGEYLLPQSDFGASYQNETGTKTASEGVINVTEHDLALKRIKGTFRFITDQNDITEGQFEVLYQ